MIAGSGFIFFALLKILSKFCWFSFVCRRLSCLSFVNDSRVGLCDWFDVWIEAEALMKSLNFPIRLRHRFESCCVARDFANLDAVWRRISTEDWLRVTWRQRNESFVIPFRDTNDNDLRRWFDEGSDRDCRSAHSDVNRKLSSGNGSQSNTTSLTLSSKIPMKWATSVRRSWSNDNDDAKAQRNNENWLKFSRY